LPSDCSQIPVGIAEKAKRLPRDHVQGQQCVRHGGIPPGGRAAAWARRAHRIERDFRALACAVGADPLSQDQNGASPIAGGRTAHPRNPGEDRPRLNARTERLCQFVFGVPKSRQCRYSNTAGTPPRPIYLDQLEIV
jgi:hypothetical protein